MTAFSPFHRNFARAMGLALQASILCALPLTAQAQTKPAYTLTILHNNDGESKLLNPSNTLNTADPLFNYGGVARFATLVQNLKNQAVNNKTRKNDVVLISSGDNFLAGAVFNASLDNGAPFYDSIAMRTIGYDALAIGNHDFDFGPDVLADFISGFNGTTKFLSANLDYTAEPRLLNLFNSNIVVRSTVVTKQGGQRIGIVGATTPLLPIISSPRNVGVDPNVIGTVQAEVNRLTNQGVKIIILTSHLQSVEEDIALAPQLRNVDVMIAGGGDELLSNPGTRLVPGDTASGRPYPILASDADNRSVPIITTAGDYKYVGRLVANFDINGRLISVDPSSGPVRVSGNPADPDRVTPNTTVQSQVTVPVQNYVNGLSQIIVGTTDVALEGRRGTGNANPGNVVPGIRTTETNLGNLFSDAILWEARRKAASFGVPQPTVAFQNGGGIRNNSLIPVGNISELETFNIGAFANFVSVVPNVSPTRLKELMENAVSRVEFADGRFAHISGFKIVYDQDQPAQVIDLVSGNITQQGSRIREIQLDNGAFIVQNGSVVAGAPDVTLATIDFLARSNSVGIGGDQYPFRNLSFTTVGSTYQQALRNFIAAPSVDGGLGGQITSTRYPAGGSGRITRLN